MDATMNAPAMLSFLQLSDRPLCAVRLKPRCGSIASVGHAVARSATGMFWVCLSPFEAVVLGPLAAPKLDHSSVSAPSHDAEDAEVGDVRVG